MPRVSAHPRIAADPREQRVQDGVVVVAMHQDEAQEGLQEGLLCDAAQKQVQVGRAGNHLVHRRLDGRLEGEQGRNMIETHVNEDHRSM